MLEDVESARPRPVTKARRLAAHVLEHRGLRLNPAHRQPRQGRTGSRQHLSSRQIEPRLKNRLGLVQQARNSVYTPTKARMSDAVTRLAGQGPLRSPGTRPALILCRRRVVYRVGRRAVIRRTGPPALLVGLRITRDRRRREESLRTRSGAPELKGAQRVGSLQGPDQPVSSPHRRARGKTSKRYDAGVGVGSGRPLSGVTRAGSKTAS